MMNLHFTGHCMSNDFSLQDNNIRARISFIFDIRNLVSWKKIQLDGDSTLLTRVQGPLRDSPLMLRIQAAEQFCGCRKNHLSGENFAHLDPPMLASAEGIAVTIAAG